MKKTYAIGDIHGGYLSLMQCLERSNFNYEKDELIVLGDVVDGWPESKRCVEELMKIKHLVYIFGNHDIWAYEWATKDRRERLWISQGGWNTIKSYNFKMPQEHIDFFENGSLWMEDEARNTLFVHAGIDPQSRVDKQPPEIMLWDRTLMNMAWRNRKKEDHKLTPYKEVYIGHTSTLIYNTDKPIHACNIWNLDTGGGWGGKLTIMNIDTNKYWQSDRVKDLYHGSYGRGDYSDSDPKVIRWLKGN